MNYTENSNMGAITIPKKITKGEELVVIPRKEYERILRFPKRKKLDRGLEKALEDVRTGRISKPFNNIKKLIKSLES